MGFSVYFPPDEASGLQWGSPSPQMKFARRWHRANTRGGPVAAEVEVRAPINDLWGMMEWLRRPMEIFNENGKCVWWGLVNEARVELGGVTFGMSLDTMKNRVAITYSYVGGAGVTIRGTTDWLQDATSVARYGIKEYLESMGEGSAASAAARQLQLLTDYATPRMIPSFGEGAESAVPTGLIVGIGWIETLKWRRFTRLEGRIEYEGGSDRGRQAIGWGILASNRIGFNNKAIHDIDGRLGALSDGDKIVVSGSVANNMVLSPTGGDSGDKVVKASAAFHFEPSDDILDGSATPGLGFVRAGEFIQVQGTSLNNRYHLVLTGGDEHVVVNAAVTGAIVTESPALTTITQGHNVQVAETVTTEIPGASSATNVRLYGYELSQSFVATQTMLVDKIALKVAAVGTPTDSFEASLWSDSSLLPGFQLVAATLLGSNLSSSATGLWFDQSNLITITAGTRYWIKMRRTGTLDPVNYYTVEMVKAGYDLCKVWTGSAWVDHPQGWSVPFKIWGAEDTCTQMQRILTDAGQFMAGIDLQVTTSGVETHQYRNGDLTAYDEMMKLLGSGMINGRRLLCNVTPGRIVQIYPEPDKEDGDVFLWDSSIRAAAGGRRASGHLPAGEWLTIDQAPAFAAGATVSPLFVDDAQCGEDGNKYKIVPK